MDSNWGLLGAFGGPVCHMFGPLTTNTHFTLARNISKFWVEFLCSNFLEGDSKIVSSCYQALLNILLLVTRLGLWRLMYHSWHKLHFYKKINCCKMFFDICNAEMAQSLSSLWVTTTTYTSQQLRTIKNGNNWSIQVNNLSL